MRKCGRNSRTRWGDLEQCGGRDPAGCSMVKMIADLHRLVVG